MTRDQMLARMGIGEADFRDYLQKYSKFVASLNEVQRKFHKKNAPGKTVGKIARSLGPDASPEEVQELFQDAPADGLTLLINCCR